MLDAVRQEVIALANTVVVKVGTNVLTREDGTLDPAHLQALADQLQRLRQRPEGRPGQFRRHRRRHGPARSGTPADRSPPAASVRRHRPGLPHARYEDCLARHGIPTAQILLTAGDFDSRGRYLNARNTIFTLFECGCLPIINENDTVSVAEIRFGDNDHLAALVTNLLQAPLLILLTVVDGLYASDPRSDPSADLLTTVPVIDAAIMEKAGSSRSALGSGGMRSKLRAARLATVAGESVIMANGSVPGILDAIFRAEPVGTLFLPHNRTMPAWKRWLGYTARPRGRLVVDAGARQAVQHQGRSLLPIGVVRVSGTFGKGDVVTLLRRCRGRVRSRVEQLFLNRCRAHPRFTQRAGARGDRRLRLR